MPRRVLILERGMLPVAVMKRYRERFPTSGMRGAKYALFRAVVRCLRDYYHPRAKHIHVFQFLGKPEDGSGGAVLARVGCGIGVFTVILYLGAVHEDNCADVGTDALRWNFGGLFPFMFSGPSMEQVKQ